MPPWLKALLDKHNSSGFADTLATLIGGHPQYERIPDQNTGSPTGPALTRAGNTRVDRHGAVTIGIAPFVERHYDARGVARPGYKAADSTQSFGDYVIGHEFGHALTHRPGDLTTEISQSLGDDMPSDAEGYEHFADDFQNAAQFLRSHKTDTLRLSPRSRKIMNAMLEHDPYRDHPIKRERSAQAEQQFLDDVERLQAGSHDNVNTPRRPSNRERILLSPRP